MQKKLFSTFVIAISVIFSFSICFAADDMMQDAANTVRNAVNDTEDAIEGAMEDAGDAIKDTTEKTENVMEDAGNEVKNAENNVEGTMDNTTSNDTYTATRTSANESATFMGMNATAWTWLILGVAAIAIIAVVWYYSMQITSENNNSRRD